jgi:hypothetical protein
MQTPIIYVFFSADRQICGLTLQPDGRNLERASPNTVWSYSDGAAMTPDAIARYVRDPHHAISNLTARGYYLVRVPAQIIPFPRRSRQS